MRLSCITGMLLLMLVMILGGCGSGQKDDRAAIAVFEAESAAGQKLPFTA